MDTQLHICMLMCAMQCIHVCTGTYHKRAASCMFNADKSPDTVSAEHEQKPACEETMARLVSRHASPDQSSHSSSMQADGHLGDPANAPYDAIHVGAAAASLPEAYLDQLKPGGRIVVPVRVADTYRVAACHLVSSRQHALSALARHPAASSDANFSSMASAGVHSRSNNQSALAVQAPLEHDYASLVGLAIVEQYLLQMVWTACMSVTAKNSRLAPTPTS